jgi:hypothetical protein
MPEPRSISELPSDVLQDAAAGRGDEDRQRRADAVGDVLLLALHRARSRVRGSRDEAALLGQAGAAGGVAFMGASLRGRTPT